jgi:hypothetical protein
LDILTKVKGLVFEEAYTGSVTATINGLPIRVLNYASLIAAKKAANRLKDQDDVNKLARAKRRNDLD